ncbi:MAG: hypothetical protein Q8P67_06040, partial [archaeon]|nr:hypothetical protein [archaeon]
EEEETGKAHVNNDAEDEEEKVEEELLELWKQMMVLSIASAVELHGEVKEMLAFWQSCVASPHSLNPARRQWYLLSHSPVTWFRQRHSFAQFSSQAAPLQRAQALKGLLEALHSRIGRLYGALDRLSTLPSVSQQLSFMCSTLPSLSSSQLPPPGKRRGKRKSGCLARRLTLEGAEWEGGLDELQSLATTNAPPPCWERHWLVLTAIVVGGVLGYRYGKQRMPAVKALIEGARQGATSLWEEHVKARLVGVLETIVHPEVVSSVVSAQSVEASERSLCRMCVDLFVEKNPGASAGELEAVRLRSALGDISFVMAEYEGVLRERKISQLISSSFLRLLLIQVQKQKLDAERALFAMDQLLRANELLFALLAALPSLLAAYLVPRWLLRRVRKYVTAPVSKQELLEMLLECERRLLLSDCTPEAIGRVCVLIHSLYHLQQLLPRDRRPEYADDLVMLHRLALRPEQQLVKMSTINRFFRRYRLLE